MENKPRPTVVVPKNPAGILLLLRALFRPTRGESIRHGDADEGQSCASAAPLQKNRSCEQESASTMVSCLGWVAGGWKAGRTYKGVADADKGRGRLKLQGVEREFGGGCVRNEAIVLEKREEINLWKRRAVKPPMPLHVQ